MTRNSRRLQKAVQAIFNDYREKASCPGQVYQNAACGCDNALQMWRGPKGDKGDTGPQGPKGDNAGSFLVDAEFVVDPEGQEPGAYLKLVLIDVAQQEQVVYVDLSYLTDIYEGGNGISIVDMVVAARLGAGLTFDANGNIASAYQFCDGLDETSNVVKVRLDSSNHILGFANGTCGGLTATVGLAPSATGVNLVLTGANGAVLSTIPLEGGTGITVQKNAQTGGFTWLADPAGLVSSQTGNQLSVSQTDNKLYVGGNTLEYTFGTGAFTLKDSSGATLSSVTVPSAVRMLEDMELRTDDGIYLHLTYLRDNGLHAYQDVSLDELLCNNVDTADDTAAAYSKAVPSGNWQTASINEIGGKTIAWNQYCDAYVQTLENSGITWTRYADGTVTGVGTATADSRVAVSPAITIPLDHVLFISGCPSGGGDGKYMVFNGYHYYSYSADYGNGRICSLDARVNTTAQIYCYVWAGQTVNLTFVPQFHDLTLMFGSTVANEIYAMEQANAGAGIAYFRQMFPATYYPYNTGELRSAGVTDVVSRSLNLLDPRIGIRPEFTVDSAYVVSQVNTSSMPLAWSYDSSTWFVEVGPGEYVFSFTVTETTTSTNSGLYIRDASNNVLKGYTSQPFAIATTVNMTPFTVEHAQKIGIQIKLYDGQARFWLNKTTARAFEPPILQTLPIPSAVQALPGYGWSAGTVYNYIDFERKVYVQNVASVDLGTLNWSYASEGSKRFYSPVSDIKYYANGTGYSGGLLCSYGYTPMFVGEAIAYTPMLQRVNETDRVIWQYTTTSGVPNICIRDTAYIDAASFKTAMSGVMLQYELATPIETDISSLLTDTTIEVEPGGSLTFKNQHDDFRLPVPNSETFIYEHPWVFEDCVKGAMQPAIDVLNARIDDVSVELTLDVHCEDVVTPAAEEPFDDYLLSGSINTLLLEPDGTISDLKHANPIPVDNTARGSFTMELFNPENTDGLSIELYVRSYVGSDGTNSYSNIDSEADSQKCATLADFLAAGEQGLPLPYVGESSLSGVRHFAENETLYASVVSNGNNSYTFTFTVRTPEVVEQEPVLDLVSGENRTDLKPLLEHVGGKVTVPTLQKVTYWVTSDDVTPPYYAAADFDWAFLDENGQLVRPSYHEVSDDYLSLTFMFYDTIPVSFDFGDYCGAAFTLVGGYTSQSPKAYANIKAIDTSAQGSPYEMVTITLAEAYAAGAAGVPFYRVTMDDVTGDPVSVDLDDSIRVRFSPVSDGTGSFKVEIVNGVKATLCLEPSCDSCIDLSPIVSNTITSVSAEVNCINESIYTGLQSLYARFYGSDDIEISSVLLDGSSGSVDLLMTSKPSGTSYIIFEGYGPYSGGSQSYFSSDKVYNLNERITLYYRGQVA